MAVQRAEVSPLAYPTTSEAARMLSVAISTLSRKSDVERIAMGGRDIRVPATEVLRLAQYFRRRPIDEIAYDLIQYAHERAPRFENAIVQEVDRTVAEFYESLPAPSLIEFLRDAKRHLPPELFNQVANAVAATGTPPVSISRRGTSRKSTSKVKGRKAAAQGTRHRSASKRKVPELV